LPSIRRLSGKDFNLDDKDLGIPAIEILSYKITLKNKELPYGEITGGMLAIIGRVNGSTWAQEPRTVI
jgi:hypothetical protein